MRPRAIYSRSHLQAIEPVSLVTANALSNSSICNSLETSRTLESNVLVDGDNINNVFDPDVIAECHHPRHSLFLSCSGSPKNKAPDTRSKKTFRGEDIFDESLRNGTLSAKRTRNPLPNG